MSDDHADFAAIFRFISVSVGLVGGLLIGTVIWLVGWSWLALPLCAAAGAAIGRVLPVGYPNGAVGRTLLRVLRTGRSLNPAVKLSICALLVGLVSALDAGLDTAAIPAAFCLFVLPVIVSAAMFGARAGLATVVLTLLAVTYFAIPPKYSFSVGTFWDFVCLGAFALVALISLAILTIQSSFAEIDDDRPFSHSDGSASPQPIRLGT
jgi:hypothetical protein